MEPHEDRISAEASARTTGQRTGGQGDPADGEAQLPPLRHGHPPGGGRWSERRDPTAGPDAADEPDRRAATEPVPARGHGLPLHADHRHGVRGVRGQRAGERAVDAGPRGSRTRLRPGRRTAGRILAVAVWQTHRCRPGHRSQSGDQGGGGGRECQGSRAAVGGE